MSELPPSARLAVRLASVAALAAGGIVVGRGVASFAAEHTNTPTAMAANADVRTTSADAGASSAPAFSSYLRSWVVSPPAVATEPQPPAVQVAAGPAAPTVDPLDSTTDANTTYTVVPGDTLSGIAVRYGVGLPELMQANDLVDSGTLAVGTRLTVPAAVQPSPATVSTPGSSPPVQLPRGTPEPVAAPGTATPDSAVRSFYARLNQADFGGAAGLWTAHMRSAFPPAQNIDSRFAQTRSLSVQRADVVSMDAAHGRATVALTLTEVVGSPPQTRTYTGDWYLVHGSNGWLLDQPDLHTG